MTIRQDGTAVVYQIEHEYEGRWAVSDLAHFLFRDLPFEDTLRGAAVGEHLRKLLKPFSATSQAFQRWGITGACDLESDAWTLFRELTRRVPDRRFRLVERTVRQQTRVLIMSQKNRPRNARGRFVPTEA